MYGLEVALIRPDGSDVSRGILVEFDAPPRGEVVAAALRDVASAMEEVAGEDPADEGDVPARYRVLTGQE